MRVGNYIIKKVIEKYLVLKKGQFIEFNERDYRVQNRREGIMIRIKIYI